MKLCSSLGLSFFFLLGPYSAIFQPLDTPFVWTQALKLIKFVACQWKRHSIKQTHPEGKVWKKWRAAIEIVHTKVPNQNKWMRRANRIELKRLPTMCHVAFKSSQTYKRWLYTHTHLKDTHTHTHTYIYIRTFTVPSIDESGASATSVVASRDCDWDLKLGSAGCENEKLFAAAQCTLCILLKDRLYNYREGMGGWRRRCSLSGIKCVCAELQSRRK